MGAWMAYAVVVGMLLGLAAMAVEALLRAGGRSARWIWALAMAAALALPVVTLARPPAPAVTTPAGAVLDSAASTGWLARARVAAGSLRAPLGLAEPFLAPAWLAASALLALMLAGGLLRLRSRARAWPAALLADGDVLISEDFGPALVGVFGPKVVVPRWMLGLDADRLRLAVWHEQEHQLAGDAQILFAGVVAVLLAPWNPALWWQLRRLRAAVELDCDARVLHRGASRALYGSLLLDVGTGAAGAAFPVPALSAPPSVLERRLIMIGRGTKPYGRLATSALTAAAVLAVAMACEAAPPTEPMSEGTLVEAAGEPDGERREGLTPFVVVGGAGEPRQIHVLGRRPEPGEPIIFVDGVRLGESMDLSMLDPDAIKRIEILKGAAAARLFGPEGANGVIQVFLNGKATASGIREDDRGGSRPEVR